VIVARLASRTDAVSALTLIARQGEWPENDPKVQELSHFRFLDIFRQFPKAVDNGPPLAGFPLIPRRPEMSVPRSVAEVLDEHVTLEVEGIDRMYLNVYVPQCSGNREWRVSFGFTGVISLRPAR
jgi:hypothetical protein